MLDRELKSTIKFMYHKLLEMYGFQNWWSHKKSFEIMVGMILVQNTNWTNAEKALISLKKDVGLSTKKILNLTEVKLIKLIRSAGLYNQKAKRVKSLSKWYLKQKISLLNNLPTDLLKLELKSI